MIATAICVTLLAIGLHFCYLHFGKRGRLMNSIPGPKPVPIFGNLLTLQVSPSEMWALVRSFGKKYYPIYRIWSFTSPIVNIVHPNDIETIVGNVKYNKKGSMYELLRPWFSTGLLTSAGRKWQVRRKILTPAFHFNVLQQFSDIFIEEGERLVQTLKSEGGPVTKNLLTVIFEHTLNVICETAMGTSLKDKGEFQYKYRHAVHSMGKILVYRYTKPWYDKDFFFNMVPTGWLQAKLLKILHGFTRKIIQERKKYHEDTNGRYLNNFTETSVETDDSMEGMRKKRLAMLDLLIAAHRSNQIDDEGIREEVDTFMFRGHDTVGMSMCFTLMLLAEHKEIQDRIREEVKPVLDGNNGKLDINALQQFTYLERCIKESLRLYPSVPFIAREPETDLMLSNYFVPAKTTVNVHIADVHRDPKFWPNPDVFDPDRFLPENVKDRHPYAYIPFSAGPRNCIGRRFAMIEMKATLALLLYNFSLEPVDYLKDVAMVADLVLRPAGQIRTKFVPLRVEL